MQFPFLQNPGARRKFFPLVTHSDDNGLIRSGLGSDPSIKEIVMDLNLAVSAQRLPDNQLVFDQESFEQSILRAEKRRAFFRTIWTRLRARMGAQVEYPQLINKIVLQGRPV